MVDIRTEHLHINKHVRHRVDEAGEHIVWFEYVKQGEVDGTVFDDLYDQGSPLDGYGRVYAPGIPIPTIYVEEMEDALTVRQEGRVPTQNLRAVMLYDDVKKSGISQPFEYAPHLNDIFYYDGRYYKISNYEVRGRLDDDVLVTATGYEVFVDQEFGFDPGPEIPTVTDLPWPPSFPGMV